MHNPLPSARRLFLHCSGILAVMLVLASSPAMAGEECQQLILAKCASCHFVKHICPRIEQGKGTLSWKWIISTMVKEGLNATDQEQDQLVHCLVTPDAKVRALCPENK